MEKFIKRINSEYDHINDKFIGRHDLLGLQVLYVLLLDEYRRGPVGVKVQLPPPMPPPAPPCAPSIDEQLQAIQRQMHSLLSQKHDLLSRVMP